MAEPNAPTSRGRREQGRQYERIALFKNRLETARSIRREWRRKYQIDRLYEMFIGDMSNAIFGSIDDDENFTVNKMLPTIKTIMPSLFLQNPTFLVRSKNEMQDPSSVLKAKMGEAALKTIAEQESHLEFSVKLALLQSFFSIGVLKCVYKPNLIKNPFGGEVMYQRDSEGIPIEINGELSMVTDETGMPVMEPDTITDDETYRWDWVNGDKMLFPDAGPNFLRWPWIAEEVTVSLETAREDPRFPTNLRTQIQANAESYDDLEEHSMDSISAEITANTVSYTDKWVTYIEMWDLQKHRQIIWAPDQSFSDNHFLLDRETPSAVEHHPYALLLGYTPIIGPKSSPWPYPFLHSWKSLQREHNIRRRQIANGAKRTARKVVFDDSTFPDADQAVGYLQSSEDMQAIKINDIQRPPVVLQDPQLPQNVAQDLNILESDWVFVTGVSGARTGGQNRGADSVFEAKVQVQSGEVRDLEMRHSVNVWLATCGRKMLRLLKETMTLGMYVRMRGTSDSHLLTYIAQRYGPEAARDLQEIPLARAQFDRTFGNDRWLRLTAEELDFEADVSVTPGSARPRNMESEKQDFFQFLSLVGGMPALMQSRSLLQRAGDMFDFIDTSLIDELYAMGQKMVELEQIKAGRMQGGEQPAAQGGGANVSQFRRNFVG